MSTNTYKAIVHVKGEVKAIVNVNTVTFTKHKRNLVLSDGRRAMFDVDKQTFFVMGANNEWHDVVVSNDPEAIRNAFESMMEN